MSTLNFDSILVVDYDLGLLDDAADTLRFRCLVVEEDPVDPDATSSYDLGAIALVPRYVGRSHASALKRLIRTTKQGIASLREALIDGWDVGPELAHEQRRLSLLEEQVWTSSNPHCGST